MRRGTLHLTRWVFNFAAAVSLLLCVATVMLWFRSSTRRDAAILLRPDCFGFIASQRGRVTVAYARGDFGFEAGFQSLSMRFDDERGLFGDMTSQTSMRESGEEPDFELFGMEFSHSTKGLSHGFWCIPHGFLVLLTAMPPALAALRLRRRKRGCCPTCGYDLRATPDRCPECGTALDSLPAAAVSR
jgi:hypothetical protein